jgi:hypothetical protein
MKNIEEQFQGLSAEDSHKITCENAAKFYNLTNRYRTAQTIELRSPPGSYVMAGRVPAISCGTGAGRDGRD